MTDGYKLDHRRQYPKGTEFVYSNWTPRSNAYFPEAEDGSVVFGIQYFIKEHLIKRFNDGFFNVPEDVAVASFKRRIDTFLGDNEVGVDHIRELHQLGYLPIRIKALPEGKMCPIGVPMMTVMNTDSRFFWLTNFLETMMSMCLWLPMTSATTARIYRKELERHARKTMFPKDVMLGFLCHDFSMRGMVGLEAAVTSGMGHLTSFVGSETIPTIAACEEYYGIDAEKELIGGTFVGIASELRKLNPTKLRLVVTHAVNYDGILKVAAVYDEVVITNSYKNWGVDEVLPSNVRVNDILIDRILFNN